jgi:hypothetical protein
MAYTLQNLDTRQMFTCDDDQWLHYLETARANGWDEEGTRYDFEYEVDETYDSMVDYLYNLWMILHLSREMFEWNGNYVEKRSQVVSESDAYYLKQALENIWVSEDRSILEFLDRGSFRICRE